MRNVTIKGLLAHKLRLALTALAIVLGVTFISGTFVLTDTLNNTFTVLFGNIYQKIDFQVRGVAQLGSGANATRNELPESLLATVRGVPGVQAAQGEVGGYAQFVAQDGKAIQTGGAPTLGVSFNPDQQISSLHLVAGGPPVTADDVVMDAGTAQKYGFTVGQRVRILFAGPPRTFTITGIAQFGSANNLAGATLAAFTLPTAQAVLQEVGHLDNINVVAAPGASKPAVQRDIASALPPGVEVVTGQTVVNEQTSSVSQALSFFSTALLVFAFISLFVGGFTIFNTFSIIVGQRTRELALLRIVGASRRQVFRSVLAEAAIVGLVSSVIGLGLGVLAALGLEALLRGFGITLPTGSLVFEPRTVLVGLAVGVGVTVVAAVGPARNAVRIPPVAALDDRQSGPGVSMRRRFIWGTAVALVGVVLLAIGLAKPAIALVGAGAVGIFIGVAMLSPAIARPLSSVIGRPLARVLGEPGKLGRENSMRSPRRTAQTASALMVGLALVAAMSVFGASLSRSATSSVDQAISADLIVSTTSGLGQLSQSVPATASAVPGVTAATTVYRSQFEVQNSLATLTGVSTQHLADTLILRMTAGSPAALAQGELLIDSTTAKSKHLAVGDTVPVKFAETGSSTLRIGGIYEANALILSYLVSVPFFLSHFSNPSLGALLLRTNSSGAVDTAVTHALAPYPNLQVQTRAQFEQAQTANVNQILGLVYALLALAVLIALIGIVNTLMLSVFERTREIGLLRAVGMKRRQVRTMIRSEAVILAIFGAIIGIIIGTGMGIALVSSLKQQGITDTVVLASRLVEFLVLAALLGLIAASWPARRAAKLDVLAAIAAELCIQRGWPLVPGRLGGLADVAVRREDQEPLEGPGEPAVVGNREHRALVGIQALLQRLGARQVKVVRRLVEQQQRGAGQLEQQDLQPGLLAAGQGAERLPGARLQLVPGERRHRLVDQERVLGHQDLDRSPSGQVRPGVGLREEARHHPGAQPPPPLVRHLLPREQPQESRLPGSVGTEDRHPVVKPDLCAERARVTRQHQVLADHGALAGPPPAQPHLHVLFLRRLLGRALLLEPAQPGHRGLQPGGHGGVVGGLLPVHADQLFDLLVLLVPATAQFLEPADPVGPGLGVTGEPAAVHPDVPVLDGHDALRASGQQLPVVADQQHGLRRGGQLLFQPALARHVQVVVRLVEQQHAVRAAQQRLEHQPFLLAAGQRAHVTPPALLVRDAERGHAAGVPVHLGLVAPGLTPFGQRRRVTHLGALVVALHHRQLGGVQPGRGLEHPRR